MEQIGLFLLETFDNSILDPGFWDEMKDLVDNIRAERAENIEALMDNLSDGNYAGALRTFLETITDE